MTRRALCLLLACVPRALSATRAASRVPEAPHATLPPPRLCTRTSHKVVEVIVPHWMLLVADEDRYNHSCALIGILAPSALRLVSKRTGEDFKLFGEIGEVPPSNLRWFGSLTSEGGAAQLTPKAHPPSTSRRQ